ncbi:MAG: phosphoribosylanthranilate isomerase [Thermodesulfobacteriota bacterium]
MGSRTRIKICGMTEEQGARHAVAAGVDALGFIFVQESPRYIRPEEARAIISSLPPFVDAVGVFRNDDPARVQEIAQYCGLTMLQLHGDESPEYCRQFPLRVIKAFQVRPGFSGEDLQPYERVAAGFLLDTYHKELAGGTGESFDWSVVASLQAQRPVILAGGIGPENVGQAIAAACPFAVDVNSAVEQAPGRKDPERVTRLMAAVAACC